MDLETLRTLAGDPEALTPQLLWKQLTREERTSALLKALEQRSPAWLRHYLADQIEDKGGFRRGTILTWNNQLIAERAVKIGINKLEPVRAALTAMHFPDRRHLQAKFLDAIGIPHDESGKPDELAKPAGTERELRRAADVLVKDTPDPVQALFYLLCIRALEPASWSNLDSWFRELPDKAVSATEPMPMAAGVVAPVASLPESPDGESAAPEVAFYPRAELQQIDGDLAALTALDDLVTLAMVDSNGGITGSLTPESIDSVVDELQQLNGRRRQTFYLAGLRDVLFDRPVATALQAENRDRWRWYYAGYISGLERRGRQAEIVQLYDAQEHVRQLGDSGNGPSAHAAPLIAEALWRAARPADVLNFVSRDAAYNQPSPLAFRLLDYGTQLLRREEIELARRFLDRAWEVYADLKADGHDVPDSVWSDVRRRRAHCLNQTDSTETARALLLELEDDPDLESRAAVVVDLGLMEAGYPRLHRLILPPEDADRADVAAKLELGMDRFRKAQEIQAGTASHAHYVIGFYELLRGNYQEASALLGRALGALEARPEVYTGQGLLIRARLHLGLALAQQVDDIPALGRAARLIDDAVQEGLGIPHYLVADTLDSLALGGHQLSNAVLSRILGDSAELDIAALTRSSSLIRSRPLADVLLARVAAPERSLTDRMRDARTVLPMLLGQSQTDAAAAMLDLLEQSALERVGLTEFQALLNDEARYGPAWTPADAAWSQAACLESIEDVAGAAGFLEQVFRQALAREDEEEAREVLEWLDDYPPGTLQSLPELHGYYATRFGDPGDLAVDSDRPINILVVGGNETQARFDDRLRLELTHTHPFLTVDFLHSGWTSNWNKHLDDFSRRLPVTDGVVFSRYMRTEFGRQARAMCRVPWRGCGGRGMHAFRRSILAVASAVTRSRNEPVDLQRRERAS